MFHNLDRGDILPGIAAILHVLLFVILLTNALTKDNDEVDAPAPETTITSMGYVTVDGGGIL